MAPLELPVKPLASKLIIRGLVVTAVFLLIVSVAIAIDAYFNLGILQQILSTTWQWIRENLLF